jgi:uncharacterized protein YdaT
VFIVQGKPREAEGIVKVVKDSRADALKTANEFLDRGYRSSRSSAMGTSRIEEFALTIINERMPKDQPNK